MYCQVTTPDSRHPSSCDMRCDIRVDSRLDRYEPLQRVIQRIEPDANCKLLRWTRSQAAPVAAP